MINTLLIANMKGIAKLGTFGGMDEVTPYFLQCKRHDFQTGAILIFTRDTGMHLCGWWKNSEYNQCYHLSLSFRHVLTGEMIPLNKKIAFRYLKAFFGDDHTKIWCEPPHSPEGKAADVWHYRLFCDENWQPMQPRGEVYSKKFTERGWKSFSEVKAYKESMSVQK